MHFERPSGTVFGLRVDRVDYDEAVRVVLAAAAERRTLRVAAANVHVVMEAHDDPELAALLAEFELVVPDGQPVRWWLERAGDAPLPDRVYGPELMRRVLRGAADRGLGVYLYGTTAHTLGALQSALEAELPRLRIAGAHAPGFGDALWRHAEADAARIRASGAQLVFVALGCPRQERWVGQYGAALGVPCLAVGAAFELLAGQKSRAPRVMQDHGLEWAYRLATEPRRTAARYLRHNPRFVWAAMRAWAAQRRHTP